MVLWVEKIIEDSGCWKIDFIGDGGDGGFCNEFIRCVIMFGDGVLMGFVLFLVEGVVIFGLVGILVMCFYWKESSGRKYM